MGNLYTAQPVDATLATFLGVDDCSVRLASGEELPATLDLAALRAKYGPIYGINLGGRVQVVLGSVGSPARIVIIEQVK